VQLLQLILLLLHPHADSSTRLTAALLLQPTPHGRPQGLQSVVLVLFPML
jgi:hypothetical protein